MLINDAGQPAASVSATQTITVTSGMTLWSLSQHYGVTISAIQSANNMGTSTSLYAGQSLVIPSAIDVYQGVKQQEQQARAATTAAAAQTHQAQNQDAGAGAHPTLREGSTGSAVKTMQQDLAQAGDSPGPLDGDFGPETLAALQKFQSSHGLQVDGVCGPLTWSALLQPRSKTSGGSGSTASTSSLSATATVPAQAFDQLQAAGFPALGLGSTGTSVKSLQLLLAGLGFYGGTIDGIFGPETQAAVSAFEQSQGLAATGGTVTRSVYNGLQAALSGHMPSPLPSATPAPPIGPAIPQSPFNSTVELDFPGYRNAFLTISGNGVSVTHPFLVSPASVQVTRSNIIQTQRTAAGFAIQNLGKNLVQVSISGMMFVTGSVEETASFESFYHQYLEPKALPSSQFTMPFTVQFYFEGTQYTGAMLDFVKSRDNPQPFVASYSLSFLAVSETVSNLHTLVQTPGTGSVTLSLPAAQVTVNTADILSPYAASSQALPTEYLQSVYAGEMSLTAPQSQNVTATQYVNRSSADVPVGTGSSSVSQLRYPSTGDNPYWRDYNLANRLGPRMQAVLESGTFVEQL